MVASGSTVTFGKTYTILTASGGVSGTFAGVGFAAPFAFTGSETLTYDADDVFLNLGAGFALLAPAGTNQNQQNVVNGINNFILGSGSNPPSFFNSTIASSAAFSASAW